MLFLRELSAVIVTDQREFAVTPSLGPSALVSNGFLLHVLSMSMMMKKMMMFLASLFTAFISFNSRRAALTVSLCGVSTTFIVNEMGRKIDQKKSGDGCVRNEQKG